jgi:hypothetical protein
LRRNRGKEDKKIILFGEENPKKRDHQKHVLVVDGRIILDLKEKGWVGVRVINLGVIRDK